MPMDEPESSLFYCGSVEDLCAAARRCYAEDLWLELWGNPNWVGFTDSLAAKEFNG